MRNSLRWAKAIYYFIFDRVAYRVLRRKGTKVRANAAGGAVNIVCGFGFPNGLSNGANYQLQAFEKLGYQVRKIDVTPAIRKPLRKIECSGEGVFIFHCAAPHFLETAWPLRGTLRRGKLIGYFAWELAEPPPDWPAYDDLWDEIWTPSAFSAQSLSKFYQCPIHAVPHVLLKRSAAPRAWRKGAEPLTFLTMADGRSSLMRKNPAAAITAFREAFPAEPDVLLVIKLQIKAMTREVTKLLAQASGDVRIRIITKSMTRTEVDMLIASANVFVSLHRAEGFGLPLLEARLAGLATIATAWSGNLDFMSADDSVLIPYTLTTMRDEGGVYGEAAWADPNVDAAAAAMRRFYDKPDEMNEVASAGWASSDPGKQLARFAAAIGKAGLDI